MSLRAIEEDPERRGVLRAEVEIPYFGVVVLKDMFLMSTRWWADFMAGLSVFVGEKGLRPVLYYSAYRVMKVHDSKGIALARERLSLNEMLVVARRVYRSLGFGEILSITLGEEKVVVRVKNSFEARGRRSDSPVCHFTAGLLAALVEDTTGIRMGPMIERECQAAGADTCTFEAEILEGGTRH